MKQEKIFSSRWLLGLLVLSSVILSACGDSSSEVARSTNKSDTSEPQYNTNSAANVTSSSPMLAKQKGSDEFEGASGERYAEISENPFLEASRAPLSTFSIDVDTASYANVRR
ncbi:MAG TPA: von Willebrand factor type A domain-containing protein, partial [Pyrinomonadaceae bacterium]|nr:von Willebrand factor type A domain-containing protein [Pyrinomonadaceae bacterium]